MPVMIFTTNEESSTDKFAARCQLKSKANVAFTVEESKMCPIAIENVRTEAHALMTITVLIVACVGGIIWWGTK